MSEITTNKVRFITVTASNEGQRIDNFLMKEYKFLPKSAIYKLLRKGEIRIDKKRIKPTRKLVLGEEIRVAPIKDVPESTEPRPASDRLLKIIQNSIHLEDDDLVILNKPSGVAVHGGTDNDHGVIEAFRQLRPELEFIELVHRIDKETSGLLLLAKNRTTLLALHAAFQSSQISKHYQTLTFGKWRGGKQHIQNRLSRDTDGQQNMRVNEEGDGKLAESIFEPLQSFENNSLLSVRLLTGRMHQIRTQLAALDYPITGDSKYGDFTKNREFARATSLKRLFLHAYKIDFKLEHSGKSYNIEIPLADDLALALTKLK
ncbi:RluA family pseudouridine synthase [Leucothrix arctica]|uniref:Pseudouridine synthase n=1 Tax=Leucothrix arctica TaxID=1481894 RepID=A0A317C969_9GAMM|nr:RluA family pseudouridine synthase [Leucothrix arctica]PWQ93873.1 23S rRNA pseudouridine(955/2504/2580) synthase [Leucothrix arctica]